MKLTAQLRIDLTRAIVSSILSDKTNKLFEQAHALFRYIVDTKYSFFNGLSEEQKSQLFIERDYFFVRSFGDSTLNSPEFQSVILLEHPEYMPGNLSCRDGVTMSGGLDAVEVEAYRKVLDEHSKYYKETYEKVFSLVNKCTTTGAFLKKYPKGFVHFKNIEELKGEYEALSKISSFENLQ